MHGARLSAILERLRHRLGPGETLGLPDAELLRRWVAARDEAAFELLLWRHGPMVLGVCRRVLGDVHEAEDALQATFLALAVRAGTIGRRAAVAGWLYRVAYRAALLARARAARRPGATGPHPEPAATAPDDDLVWREQRPVLDEEINRLPERYRLPFVLCCCEDRTHAEVARLMGCPVGTVASRLARARERLRARLTRRGVTLAMGAAAVTLSGAALSAAVPARLVGAAAHGAALVAAGRAGPGLVSANSVLLMKGVVRAMAMTKVKVVTAVVVTLALLGAGTGTVAYRLNGAPLPAARAAAGQPAGAPEAAPAVAPGPLADPRERARAEQQRATRAVLVAERRRAEEVYRHLEAELTLAFTEARMEMVRQEEYLRGLEREQAADRESEGAERRRLRERAQAAERVAEWVGEAAPRMKEARQERERAREWDAKTKVLEAERTEALIRARQKLVQAEEKLRQLERLQGAQREQALAEWTAAADADRQAQRPASPAGAAAPVSRELERRLDRLLREVTELRQAVERQRSEKGRAPNP
jgi:RNA polymerase sigma factor (sigma-70 family)